MVIEVTRKSNAKTPALLAEIRIIFGPGPLEGLALTGFAVWRAPSGDISVTFPSRTYTTKDKTTKHIWYLTGEAADEHNEAVFKFRAHLVRHYKDWVANNGI